METACVDIGTHLSEQEVITYVFSNNEVNTSEIERVRIGWNKICIREDLAKDKIVFSSSPTGGVNNIPPIQQNSMKNGYDENINYNKSDETKCEINDSITNN